MTHTFLVPIDSDVTSIEDLQLTAQEIGDAVERAGLTLAGDVKPWTAPTLTQPTFGQPQPPSQNI